MFKIAFFVPQEHAEQVKSAMFETGAGKIGDYDRCCWQVLGEGQFRPMSGSQPYIGQQGQLERVPEYKVEMVCRRDTLKAAIAALRQAHPYEEPAFDVMALVDPDEFDA